MTTKYDFLMCNNTTSFLNNKYEIFRLNILLSPKYTLICLVNVFIGFLKWISHPHIILSTPMSCIKTINILHQKQKSAFLPIAINVLQVALLPHPYGNFNLKPSPIFFNLFETNWNVIFKI